MSRKGFNISLSVTVYSEEEVGEVLGIFNGVMSSLFRNPRLGDKFATTSVSHTDLDEEDE